MSEDVSLDRITEDHRPAVERLWQLYMHDLSEHRGYLPDADGLYTWGRLPLYFGDPDRCGYLIRRSGGLAGFALVRGLDADARVVGEFFVVRALRRRQVGRRAARHLFDRHPGRWEIPFQESNAGAARFWRAVATEAAGSSWTEEQRPLPDKPALVPDTWVVLETPAQAERA
jgi:predicted acetyltransferase